MHSETPQILQRKPGEPGGEKARAQAETVLGLVLLKLGFTTDHLTDGQLDRARDIVAGALAACALAEAKWWEQLFSQDHNDGHVIMRSGKARGYSQVCEACERLAALERAAGEASHEQAI